MSRALRGRCVACRYKHCRCRPMTLTERKQIDNIWEAIEAGDLDALVRAQEAFRRGATQS